MRINENTVICGDKVILVPYRPEHVPTYHEWMKSSELLELTASDPLSYEEEVEMQQKWHKDEDKLTFIVLDRSPDYPASASAVLSPKQIMSCRMVGDVNMFMPNGLEEEAECEIMIASSEDRRKGFAIEALTLFLAYAISTLKIRPTNLIAKISRTNIPSISLFVKLGFGIVKLVKVWDEVELRWGYPTSEGNSVEHLISTGSIKERAEWTDEEQRKQDSKWSLELPVDRIGPYE